MTVEMVTKWYYRAGESEIGPISSGGLRQKAFGGTILPETLVRKGAEGDWIPAKHVSGLFDPNVVELSVPGPPAVSPPEHADATVRDDAGVSAPISSAPSALDDSAGFDPYHTWLGIPSEEQPPNHYRLLGIRPFEDDPEVIENAADRQMVHLRNRQTGRHSELTQKLLNDVAAAKICLLRPNRKAAYDRQLRQEVSSAAANLIDAFRMGISRHGRLIGTLAAGCVVLVTTLLFMFEFLGEANEEHAPFAARQVHRGQVPNRTLPASSNPTPPPLPEPTSLPLSNPTPPLLKPTPLPSPEPTPPPFQPTPLPSPEPTPSLPVDSTPPPSADPTLRPSPDPTPSGLPEPTPSPASPVEAKRLARFGDMFQQQLPLFRQWQQQSRIYEGCRKEWLEKKGQWAGKIHEAGILEVEARGIVQMTRSAEKNLGTRIAPSPQLLYLQGQHALLLLEAENLKKDSDRKETQAQDAKAKADQLREEADRVAAPWFSLCDPFGKLGPAVHQRALRAFDEWIAEEPGLSRLYLARGFAHLHGGNYEGALADFDQVADLDPRTKPLMMAARGYTLSQQDQTRKAAATEFAGAIKLVTARRRDQTGSEEELDRTLGMIYVFRGQGYVEQGDYARAAKDFKEAVRPGRDGPEAHEAIACLYASCPHGTLRNGKLAVDHALKAYKQSKLKAFGQAEEVCWHYLDTLAAAYAEGGDFPSAVKWAHQALKRTPREQLSAVRRRIDLYQEHKPYHEY